MKNKLLLLTIGLSIMFLPACNKKRIPISLHPENPHYFLFRGKPVVLIGSTEHYGAVLNLGFDNVKYLDELQSKGLNVTRTFTGIYLEPQGAFGIANNSMAPGNEKLICPWARSNQHGYAGGGNKFDLTKWDDAYFARLKNFIAEAGKRNIVVELDLFSNFYDTVQWKLSPVNEANNINAVGKIADHKEVLSLRHPEVLDIQEKMVKKIVSELKDFDNLYYEICNEPYFGDLQALDAWEEHMTKVVAAAEKDFQYKHLISHNIANGFQKVETPNSLVSILNFHYAKPPVTVEMNYSLNKVIGDNETGFNGIEDVNYRTEAWDFLVAGGALFNNLDYSFAPGNEDGTYKVLAGQPGGGGPALRNQLKILKDIFDGLDFVSMKPMNSSLKNTSDGNTSARVLAKEGEQYLVYINNTKKGNTNYSLRYEGFLTAPVSGKYWMYTVSDDGVHLFIDNKQLINNWSNHAAITDSVSIDLKAGKPYPFKLEYYQATGGAELSLKWKTPGKNTAIATVTTLTAKDGKTPGLSVIKFAGIDLKDTIAEKVVTQIDQFGFNMPDQNKASSFELLLDLPKGSYKGMWIDPVSGKRTEFKISDHPGGTKNLVSPLFSEDIALEIVK